jgi:uncharacterized coiled-coil protein SlyX
MRIARLGAGLAALILGAQALAAQQPAPQQGRDSSPGGTMGMQDRRMMDSLNARLDSLVVRMNRATGNEKMAAMARTIDELVAQRKTMQQHMRRMMESRRGRMDMMKESAIDSASADTDHAGHHPNE